MIFDENDEKRQSFIASRWLPIAKVYSLCVSQPLGFVIHTLYIGPKTMPEATVDFQLKHCK